MLFFLLSSSLPLGCCGSEGTRQCHLGFAKRREGCGGWERKNPAVCRFPFVVSSSWRLAEKTELIWRPWDDETEHGRKRKGRTTVHSPHKKCCLLQEFVVHHKRRGREGPFCICHPINLANAPLERMEGRFKLFAHLLCPSDLERARLIKYRPDDREEKNFPCSLLPVRPLG